MNRLAEIFNRPGHKALIAYVTVGYPNLETTLKVVPQLAASGCDAVELGIPFSDPLADGATIQRASFQALQNGVTPAMCLEIASELRQKTNIPLIFMTYYNPVFKYGIEPFCRSCSLAGVDGLIIPDLPPDEGETLNSAAASNDLSLIYLLAPTSNEKRIRLVAAKSQGFIYLVSVTGVTGARESLPVNLDSFISRVRQIAHQPLCIGFGISTPEQAKRLGSLADGIIVGSRLIQLLEKESGPEAVTRFITALRASLDEL